jgi:hypothetical protein
MNIIRALFQGRATTQRSGDNSTNYQANKIIIRETGLTVADAKEVALMVVEQNFIKFSEEAKATAKVRAEEMVNEYLAGLVAKDERLVDEVQSPGVQMALVSAQKEFIKSGDKDLSQLLVNVLVERTAQPQRNLLQITLDDSLTALGRLTNSHVSTILLSFLLNNFSKGHVTNVTTVKTFFDSYVQPLIPHASRSRAAYDHLVSVGCGEIVYGNGELINNILSNYKAAFNSGMDEATFLSLHKKGLVDPVKYPHLVVHCGNNYKKVQIGYLTDHALSVAVTRFGLSNEVANELQQIFNDTTMPIDDIKSQLLGFGSYMAELFDLWENTPFSSLTLNNIGKVLAISAFQKEYNAKLDMQTWVQD